MQASSDLIFGSQVLIPRRSVGEVICIDSNKKWIRVSWQLGETRVAWVAYAGDFRTNFAR